jgi:hypothetical protein
MNTIMKVAVTANALASSQKQQPLARLAVPDTLTPPRLATVNRVKR